MFVYHMSQSPFASFENLQGGQQTCNFWKPGKVKEFSDTWKKSRKSQGISWNLEKSRNFTCTKQISPNLKFFQDSFKWWTRITHACSYIKHAHGFLSKNKNEFKLWNNLYFFLDQKVYFYWLNFITYAGIIFFDLNSALIFSFS